MATAEPIPFCQRNLRAWVGALVLSGVAVLGFAVWLAVTESGSDGVRHVKRALGIQRQAAAARAAAGSPHGAAVPRAGVGRGGPAVRAAWTPPCGRTPGTAALQVAGTPRTAGGNSTAHRLQAGFNRAADVVRPSVVNINAVRRSGVLPRPTAPNAPRFADPFDGVPDKVIAGQAFESIGSGVIVDERGYVLTNNHLVSRATMIMVTRFNHNNEHLPADLVAADPSLDLALLRLRGAAKFPPASFANSSQVEVGDWVLAVGNPFGLGHTVTSGIVSARRQQLTIGNVSYSNLLQTDAPINRGSSGGPLCDLDGKIVGINTAIYAPTGVFSGAGFAIPANRAAAFVARVLGAQPITTVRPQPVAQRAPTIRPLIGAAVIDVTPQLAAKLELPAAKGAFVSSVAPNSPASDAELKNGDVIVALNGRRVDDQASLRAQLSLLVPNAPAPLVIWRAGRFKRLRIKTRGFRQPRQFQQPGVWR